MSMIKPDYDYGSDALDDMGVPKKHPLHSAVILARSFREGGLMTSPLRFRLGPLTEAFASLYFGKMPWKVRWYVLIHGKLPLYYSTEQNDEG